MSGLARRRRPDHDDHDHARRDHDYGCRYYDGCSDYDHTAGVNHDLNYHGSPDYNYAGGHHNLHDNYYGCADYDHIRCDYNHGSGYHYHGCGHNDYG